MQENEKHLAYNPFYGLKHYWQIECFKNNQWKVWTSAYETKEEALIHFNILNKNKMNVEFRLVEVKEPEPPKYQRTCTPEWYENGYQICKSYVDLKLKAEIIDFARKEEDAKILLEKVKVFYANEKDEPNLEMYRDENGLYIFEIVEINPDYTHGNLRDILNGLNEPAVESEVLAYVVRLQNKIDHLNKYIDELEDEKKGLEKTIDEYENDDVVAKLEAELQRKEQIAKDALNTAKQAVETSEKQAESIAILQTQNKKAEELLDEQSSLLDEAQKTINQQNFILNSIKANQPIQKADENKKEEVAAELDTLREENELLKQRIENQGKDFKSQLGNAAEEIKDLRLKYEDRQNSVNRIQFELYNQNIKVNNLIEKLRNGDKSLYREDVLTWLRELVENPKTNDDIILVLKDEIRTLTINLQNAEAKYKLAVENSQTVIDELKEKLRYTEQESQTFADELQKLIEQSRLDVSGNLLMQLLERKQSLSFEIDENQLYAWTVINTEDNGVYWRYVIGKQSDFKEMAKFADGASSPIFVPALVNFFLCDGNREGWSRIKYAKPEYADQKWQCIFI